MNWERTEGRADGDGYGTGARKGVDTRTPRTRGGGGQAEGALHFLRAFEGTAGGAEGQPKPPEQFGKPSVSLKRSAAPLPSVWGEWPLRLPHWLLCLAFRLQTLGLTDVF